MADAKSSSAALLSPQAEDALRLAVYGGVGTRTLAEAILALLHQPQLELRRAYFTKPYRARSRMLRAPASCVCCLPLLRNPDRHFPFLINKMHLNWNRFAKQPQLSTCFASHRMAVYRVLSALCTRRWAAVEVVLNAALLERLTDARAESAAAVCQWRFVSVQVPYNDRLMHAALC